ncbi:DNA-3-methyladenine glycosylase-like isoform X2 [Fopius arisanus]|uniref:DNA-3-methyladenine glycosylase n=1 Tax=Fopius arisanus TaxID=64838 RepID=A0A9R1TDJ7_9HYME|nr:PREDICTED: DNA-3-methyladenine glycosylase-like isoform X2 [Fopius arisanus]
MLALIQKFGVKSLDEQYRAISQMKRARLFRRAKDTRTVINLNAGHQTDVNVHPLEEIEESTKKSRKKRIDLPPEPDRDDYSCESKSKNKLKFENISKNLCKDENPKVLAKKTRAKVDLDSMKEELKQLEDPPETDLEKEISVNRLNYEFYDTPCEELAQNLLGKILVRRLDNGIVLKGRIVETESYLGEIDAASHTFNNRVTPRNIPMYMLPGTIYVYMTYGMYYCFNISSGGKGAAVLLRALEPLENTEEMQNNRLSLLKSKRTKDFRTHELCNGPSKLCTAFRINKDSCKYSLCTWKKMWIEEDPGYPREDIKIIKTSRIGIESVGAEWSKKPLRFYIYGNSSVSKRDKKSEDNLIIDNT